ncbi:helix-turn-helix transcriptional regulator [Psychrosphaera aestuarii]
MFIIKFNLTNIKQNSIVSHMNIRINLDIELAKQKMSLTELSQKIGISMTNLSLLKNGKVKAIRFSTLEAICQALNCQPGDILVYEVKESELI